MKKLLFATAALAFAASAGVAMAHDDGDYRDNGYQHQWDRGEHQRFGRDHAERDGWRGGYDHGYRGSYGERRHAWNRYHYRVYRGGYSANPYGYGYAYPSGYGQPYGYSPDGGY